MRTPDTSLPSAFVKLDTRVNAADSFCDAYTHYRMRKNHNILVAQRARRTIMTRRFNRNNSADGSNLIFKGYRGQLDRSAPLLFSVPILTSQLTREITVKVMARKTNITGSTFDTDNNVTLYAVVRKQFAPKELAAGGTMTVTASVAASDPPAAYSTTIALPSIAQSELYWWGREEFMLDLYCGCLVDDTDTIDAAQAVYAAGNDWIDFDTAAVTVNATAGDLIYPNDGTDTWEPRMITRVHTDSSSIKRCWVDRRWRLPPNDGWTVSTRAILGVQMSTVSVYEEPVTDFYAIKGYI